MSKERERERKKEGAGGSGLPCVRRHPFKMSRSLALKSIAN